MSPPQTRTHEDSRIEQSICSRIAIVIKYLTAITSREGIIYSIIYLYKLAPHIKQLSSWMLYVYSVSDRDDKLHNINLAIKPLSSYAVYGLPVSKRISFLQSHFNYITRCAPFLLEVSRSEAELELGCLHGKRGETYRLTLEPAGYCGKEGELSLMLSDGADGLEFAKLTCLFIQDDEGGPVLLIGGLQGPSSHCGPDAKARIVAATRSLSGLRPKMAVFLTACALARSLGADSMLAVSNKTHSINADAWWQRRKMRADYDAFWSERGGTPHALGFRLSTTSPPRSQCERRNEHRKQIESSVDRLFRHSPQWRKPGDERVSESQMNGEFKAGSPTVDHSPSVDRTRSFGQEVELSWSPTPSSRRWRQ